MKTDKRELVGVFGKTGAGKSSLINAVTEQKKLLPSGSITACTSVMIKVEANMQNSKYEAHIEFITKEVKMSWICLFKVILMLWCSCKNIVAVCIKCHSIKCKYLIFRSGKMSCGPHLIYFGTMQLRKMTKMKIIVTLLKSCQRCMEKNGKTNPLKLSWIANISEKFQDFSNPKGRFWHMNQWVLYIYIYSNSKKFGHILLFSGFPLFYYLYIFD